jgi:hypothetical protein
LDRYFLSRHLSPEGEVRHKGIDEMTFEQILTLRSPASVWEGNYTQSEYWAYRRALDEALDLDNGKIILIDANLSFRSDIKVEYLGRCERDDGTEYFTLSFRDGVGFEAIIALETDLTRSYFAFCGDRAIFQRLALELRLFQGSCFAHLRDDQAAA